MVEAADLVNAGIAGSPIIRTSIRTPNAPRNRARANRRHVLQNRTIRRRSFGLGRRLIARLLERCDERLGLCRHLDVLCGARAGGFGGGHERGRLVAERCHLVHEATSSERAPLGGLGIADLGGHTTVLLEHFERDTCPVLELHQGAGTSQLLQVVSHDASVGTVAHALELIDSPGHRP